MHYSLFYVVASLRRLFLLYAMSPDNHRQSTCSYLSADFGLLILVKPAYREDYRPRQRQLYYFVSKYKLDTLIRPLDLAFFVKFCD